MDKIYVVQRQTLDWNCLGLESFKLASIDFCRNWRKPDDFVYNLAKLWNNTFGCSYFETRARLKVISENHNSGISDTEFVPYKKNQSIALNGSGYVFVDDDDWFSPNLGSVLRPYTTKREQFLLWRATNIGSPNHDSPILHMGLNGRCMTNNYMIKGDWIRRQGSVIKVFSHSSAVITLQNEKNIEQLDRYLSVSNKGPISSVSLNRGLGVSREPSKLRAMVKAYLDRMGTINEDNIKRISWVAPMLKETIAVYQDVYDSRL